MGDNYEPLLQRVSEASGLSRDDLERRVEAKRAKLSGLVSKEGALQIVAAELGINFDQERMKISELVQGMRRANVIAKILEIYPVRSYKKNNREGKVCNLLIADESSNVKAVLWDSHHIGLIEEGKLKKGDVVEISNGGVRNGELHLSSFSDIKKSKELLSVVIEHKVFPDRKIKDVRVGESFKTRAVIVQMFDPRFFEVCSTCGKKVVNNTCAVHGNVEPKKRALVTVVLDDGSETMRCVFFGDSIKQLGVEQDVVFDSALFSSQKERILGEEMIFCGNARKNDFSNALELNVEQVLPIEVGGLIKEFEAK